MATSAPSNLIQVTSPEQFQSLLSADLERLAVLNFWAEWAKPCEKMNESVKVLAGRFPQVLFLNVSWRVASREKIWWVAGQREAEEGMI